VVVKRASNSSVMFVTKSSLDKGHSTLTKGYTQTEKNLVVIFEASHSHRRVIAIHMLLGFTKIIFNIFSSSSDSSRIKFKRVHQF